MSSNKDHIIDAWKDDIEKIIHPSGWVRFQDAIRIRGQDAARVLIAIDALQREHGFASKYRLDQKISRYLGSSDSQDLYIKYLCENGFISDDSKDYHDNGRVEKRHEIKLTERGRSAVVELLPVMEKLDEFILSSRRTT